MQKRRVDIIGFVLISTGLLLYGLFFVKGTVGRIRLLKTTREQIETSVHAVEKSMGNIKAVEQELKLLDTRVAVLKSRFAVNNDASWFLRSSYELAIEYGVNIVSLTPAVPKQEQYFKRVPFVIKVSGRFNNIFRFMDRLEHAGKVAHIETLNIKRNEDRHEVEAELRVSLFTLY